MTETWTPPSPPAAELIRTASRLFLDNPGGLVDDVEAAIVDAAPRALLGEPTLAEEVAASTHANVTHWATWNLRDPGSRVPANLTPEVLGIARDAVRRGLDEGMLGAYRTGQNIVLRFALAVLFSLSSDPDELREALDVFMRSTFAFVEDTLDAIRAQMQRERDELTRGTHAERFEVVTLILEGAPIADRRAAARLGYDLERRHTAAILWSDPATADHRELARAAEAVTRASGGRRPLTVVASASSLWVWFVAAGTIDAEAAHLAIEQVAGVRAALGPAADGIEGFRRSHLDAVATQRLMLRMPAELRVAGFEDVAAVALAAHDEERAAEFLARTLGELASADPELRRTLRIYIREQFSASRAARALFAHRNTVLNRLQRAEAMLPVPLERRGLDVGLALEIDHWLGPRAGAG